MLPHLPFLRSPSWSVRRAARLPERRAELAGGGDRRDAFLEELVVGILERDHDLRVSSCRHPLRSGTSASNRTRTTLRSRGQPCPAEEGRSRTGAGRRIASRCREGRMKSGRWTFPTTSSTPPPVPPPPPPPPPPVPPRSRGGRQSDAGVERQEDVDQVRGWPGARTGRSRPRPVFRGRRTVLARMFLPPPPPPPVPPPPVVPPVVDDVEAARSWLPRPPVKRLMPGATRPRKGGDAASTPVSTTSTALSLPS